MPTHVLTLVYAESGTASAATLLDINNESGAHFVQVGNNVFVFGDRSGIYNHYYALGTNGTEVEQAELLLNTSLGNWQITVFDIAKQGGTYPELIAGQAAQISSTLPNTHKEEFLFQTSAGSSDIGSGVAEIQSLNGFSYVKNQAIDPRQTTITESGITWTLDGRGNITVVGTLTDRTTIGISNRLYSFVAGHKYYVQSVPKINLHASDWSINPGENGTTITTATTSGTTGIVADIMVSHIGETFNLMFIPMIVDLTLMFGAGNEPTTVDEYYARVGQDYIPYNTGEIVDSTLTSYTTVGYNQWDEESESGYFNLTTGEPVSNTSVTRTKNFIKVFPNTQYEYYKQSNKVNHTILTYDINFNYIGNTQYGSADHTFTTPANCAYIKFAWVNSNTNDICIFIYWDGSRVGYEQYDKHTYPLPGIVLRSAGDVYDELKPDGTLTRRVGTVDLGTLDWNIENNCFVSAGISSNIAYQTDNLTCSKYEKQNHTYRDNLLDKHIMCTIQRYQIAVKDSDYTDAASFKTAMSGVYLNYELATATETASGATYQANTIIDDFGTQEFNMPGSMTVKYPVNLQGFLESLYSLTGGDPSKIQIEE